ncbi:efflux RND transporter periplasmic adaptor subunit [Stenotrophomonas sp. GD03701]|uniref:Efflux RND transporter periplasmic adaptor subunit n=1 Tax=Stenotrophomonas maltophilia TaxID=40324 RepID=A0A2J0SN09_STEMA|nr:MULTISPECIES: efflux RND transporter periplasmic adaptor subunit [Stenotrophomonas]MBA0310504.1 efflux RND transporter periplasmic adaptor subunit [Stenotrophomonas maltophilia]MBH1864612.1 efflux RND transporter periplasmic adaptor subunit [Stenotrophomonas maltophilia]MDH1387476.1 efflux RND transporter periplasmic adaptor subunit [Stenotrophomonas sp. GD03701]MDH1392391.1 efflux RND transporter periplasmic adaptor subunit [Stenotrophomonas sp. GD03702]MDQ7300928.1 efflux RND transporter 
MSAVPRKRRRALIVAATLLCSALILFAWFRPAPPPQLQVAPVGRGNIEQVVEATGTLKPSRLVSVGAQVSGRIDTLHVKLGDKVKAGDPIADIDSRTQRNALLSAQAAQRTARANRDALATDLRQFELALHRQQQLVASQLVARADFDAAKAKVDATREQIAALDGEVVRRQTDVDIAQTNLEYTRITAPTDGTVLAVVARQGQTVNAVQSAPTIVMLGNQDVMTVYAEISEADVVHTSVGQEAFFTILGDAGRRYSSTLRDIAPAPESITNEDSSSLASPAASGGSRAAMYYNGQFDVNNADGRLRSYMTAQVRIVLGRANDVLTIPSAALGARAADGSYSVLVRGADGHASTRRITTGLDDQIQVEVRSGLKEGEQVVLAQASDEATIAPVQPK